MTNSHRRLLYEMLKEEMAVFVKLSRVDVATRELPFEHFARNRLKGLCRARYAFQLFLTKLPNQWCSRVGDSILPTDICQPDKCSATDQESHINL